MDHTSTHIPRFRHSPPHDYHSQSQSRTNVDSNIEASGEDEISPESNSLELMIRAHDKIRTLEQDNEILRMHVQLLSKDNKNLSQKVEQMDLQKKSYMKQNEDLRKKIKQLQIKIDGYIVKGQLQTMEKQNMDQKKKCLKDNDKNEHTSAEKSKQMALKVKGETAGNNGQNQLLKQFCRSRSQHYLINTKHQVSSQQTTIGTNDQKNHDQNLTDAGLKKNASCFLLNRQQKLNQSIKQKTDNYPDTGYLDYRPSRNLSQHRYSGAKETEPASCQKQTANEWPSKQCTFYEIPKHQQSSTISTQQNFYLTQGTPTRVSNSPLIRKNSPQKQRDLSNELHGHKLTPYSLGEHEKWGKKFNYTSWRKSNNNLMVWRTGGEGSTRGKAILLNR